MKAYLDRPWGANFQSLPWPLSHERILEAVEAQAGSIGKPSANAVGFGVGALRRLIEEMGLESKINALRKKFRRAPARFRPELDCATPIQLYERRLPPRFR